MPLDVSDIAQNALMKIAARLSTTGVPDGRPIATWLNTVAEDCFVDAVRAAFGRKRGDARGRPVVLSLDEAMASVGGSSVAL